MPDKRTVDELSIEELERILAIKKREARQQRLSRMRQTGRVIETSDTSSPVPQKVAVTPPPEKVAKASSEQGAVKKQRPVEVQKKQRSSKPQFEDEVDKTTFRSGKDDDRDSSIWRTFVNRTLLLVEIAAVFGIVVIGVMLFMQIGKLEEETAAAAELADEQRRAAIPTIAPTPQYNISDFVLPGGHTPPQSDGTGAQFNYDEVPAHLQSLVQQQILNPVISRPEPTDQTPLAIVIPALNINETIVQGVDWEALRQGVGQLPNGVTPAQEQGNVVLAAHNDIYGEIFRYLDQLQPGDQFQIQTRDRVYTYTITQIDFVDPSDVHVMESRGNASATLISCYPYRVNNQRIVVYADLDET